MDYDIIIIGSGIVGLATAYKIKQKRPKLRLCVIEKESESAYHQTGHNSGVLHSGIYYKTNSLKQRNCYKGLREIISFAKEKKIPFKVCGKLILAHNKKELPRLEALYEQGKTNQLEGLRLVNQKDIHEIEPYAQALKGIYCPQTGIIDFKKIAKALEEELKEKNTDFYFNCPLRKIIYKDNGVTLESHDKSFNTKKFVAACGLHSDRIAALDPHNHSHEKIFPFKGSYYYLRKEASYLVKNLIYPVPDPLFPFLGVHLTRTIHDEIKAGPNASLAFSRSHYESLGFSPGDLKDIFLTKEFWLFSQKNWRYALSEYQRTLSKKIFTKSLQKLVPDLKEHMLERKFCGIRAQLLEKTGKLCDDFKLEETSLGLHVLNAPSPAATASFAIADHISSLILRKI